MKIESSETAKNTFNPIRSIVDKLQPPASSSSPAKNLISLSLGDPTVFGNIGTADEVRAAIVRVIGGGGADGYAASVGMEVARESIAWRYKERFDVDYEAKVSKILINSWHLYYITPPSSKGHCYHFRLLRCLGFGNFSVMWPSRLFTNPSTRFHSLPYALQFKRRPAGPLPT